MDRDRTVADDLTDLREENAELKREISLLKGGMDYFEKSKIPWLERELERERCRQGRG